MVSILINIIQHVQYFFSFQAHIPTVCLFLSKSCHIKLEAHVSSGILYPFTPLTARKTKIWKEKKKNFWRYYHFTHVYQQLWSHDAQFLRYGAWWTDGHTDRYIEVTERGTPPKKSLHTFFRGCSEKLLFESFQRFPENYLK